MSKIINFAKHRLEHRKFRVKGKGFLAARKKGLLRVVVAMRKKETKNHEQ
jgi:hypothetical protein